MADVEDIVIVGAGISGLATSLGLHRLGIKSLVLESSDKLRTTGFAFTVWTNAWRALDALGVADVLRSRYHKLTGLATTSVTTGLTTSEMPFSAVDPQWNLDCRCVNRNVLLETMESELPRGIIRYSSRVVHIDLDGDGCYKTLHLADGSIIKSKVLIGCDGVNSVVAKILGFKTPAFAGRWDFRGFVNFEDGHGLEPKFMEFLGNGFKYGVMPVDDHSVYWFFNFTPSPQELEANPSELKQLILDKLGKVPDEMRKVFEKTQVENIAGSALRFRYPWELIWGNICKDNICVLGDALHPMTPDLGQGGCSALEDGVVLARVLGEALRGGGEERGRIKKGLERYARERRWRSFDLISASYFVGFMQQSDGIVMHFLRDKLMAKFVAGLVLGKTRFDCGKLTAS